MTLRTICLALAAACSLTGVVVVAATISEPVQPSRGLAGKPATMSRVIRLTGMIEEGDSKRLRAFLSGIRSSAPRSPGRPLATIELSSQGGDLLEGMKLGYLFREFDVATLVRAGDSCLSSCALAFLGGTASHLPTDLLVARTLEIGGTLGFHNFYLNPNHEVSRNAASPREGIAKGFNEARGAAGLLVHYVAALGVDASLIARMLGQPPDVWEYADRAGQFMDLKICPSGLSRLPPPPQAGAINICKNVLGATEEIKAPQVRRLSQTEAKRQLLDYVQKNVAAMRLRGTLAEELAAVVASRDERLIASVYSDLRAAGLPLPQITGPAFEVNDFAAGVYDLQCIVSVSLDDPDHFDAVLQGPMGLARPPLQPPAACGRLFSFDRSDMLNPERK